MLEEKDLQAIAHLMEMVESRIDQKMSSMEDRIDRKMSSMEERIDQKMGSMEERIDQKMSSMEDRIDQKLEKQKQEILDEATQRMKVLLDTEVSTKFNLLAEGQEEILRRMPNEDDMDIIDGRLTDLETAVKKHSLEIEALKKAQ